MDSETRCTELWEQSSPILKPAKLEGESARRTKDALFYSTVLSVLWPSIIGFPRRNRGGDDAHNIRNSLHCYHQRKITRFWFRHWGHTLMHREGRKHPFPILRTQCFSGTKQIIALTQTIPITAQDKTVVALLHYASQNKPRNEESLPCNEEHLFCLGQDLSECDICTKHNQTHHSTHRSHTDAKWAFSTVLKVKRRTIRFHLNHCEQWSRAEPPQRYKGNIE